MNERFPAVTPRLSFLPSVSYAHRGLHGGADGPVENSIPAFEAALRHGFGIECDVRLSADGAAFVFHDESLERLTTEQGVIGSRSAQELDRIPLGGDGPIPRLAALLALVAGQVPLLIELKIAKGEPVAPLCEAVRRDLRGYTGPIAVMSFHPGVSLWFRMHAPETVRGLVITEKKDGNCWKPFKRHLAIFAANPDFLAYDIRNLPNAFAARARARGIPVLSWTVRSHAQWNIAREHADAAIFEERAADG